MLPLGFVAEVRMAFEMICGQCRGNLLVEQFGVVVACPHCGAHLHVPAPENSEPAAPAPIPVSQSAPVKAPIPAGMSTEGDFKTAPTTEEMNEFTGHESEPSPSVEISVTSPVSLQEIPNEPFEDVIDEVSTTASGSSNFLLSGLMAPSDAVSSEPPLSAVEPQSTPFESSIKIPQTSAASVISDPVDQPTSSTSTGLSGLFGSGAASTPPEQLEAIAASPVPAADLSDVAPAEGLLPGDSSHHEHSHATTAPASAVPAPPNVNKSASKDHILVSKSAFIILLSYVSAITIGFVYLLYFGSAKSSDYGLESLPDVVPKKKKTTGVAIYKETAPMPDGHDLQVGDRQRFGNIEVSVLKVTRGPIKFEHFSDAKKFRFPSASVLKLWLRFKNVSEDQEIAPLDDHLLFARAGKNRLDYRSNQFVCRAEQKENPDAKRIIAFDHTIGSGWDLAGLSLEKPLQPGESRDYYIPTCENDLEILTGELLWRVHIRKGYSSRGNGVTTLFEVRFNSQLIRDEAA